MVIYETRLICIHIHSLCSIGQYLYDIPEIDALHGYLTTSYTTSVITNVGLHLTRNIRRNIFVVFKRSFLEYKTQIRSPISVLSIDLPFEVISSFDFAFINAPYLLYFSVALLREATNFTLLPFEFRSWSLLPVVKHRIATNTNNEKNKITLEYGISSDGHIVYVLFSAEAIEMLPEINDDEQLSPISVDIIQLEKRVRSGFAWATQVELNKRFQYSSDGIQKWYDLIPSPDVTECSSILSYIQTISISHVQKRCLYSNRQQTLDHITYALRGRTITNEPYRLCHSSTNRRRKKKRGSYNVGMLDLKVNTIGESFSHMATQAFQALCVYLLLHLERHLSKKGIVILVDEYMTSRVCSHCKNELQDIAVPNRGFDCDHRKKIVRLRLEKKSC
ncbi:hypothetical protein AB4K20DRAFT_1989458 [Rhizopus microsporus]